MPHKIHSQCNKVSGKTNSAETATKLKEAYSTNKTKRRKNTNSSDLVT